LGQFDAWCKLTQRVFKNQKVLEHGRHCARTPQANDVTPSGMMGNEVKVKVDKLANSYQQNILIN
jgi:hypothetical protein